MVDGVPYGADGKPLEHKVTRIEIGSPQFEEHIVIQDDNGIEIEKDPTTGMPIVHAEHMTIASEGKKKPNLPRFLERLFPRKEK